MSTESNDKKYKVWTLTDDCYQQLMKSTTDKNELIELLKEVMRLIITGMPLIDIMQKIYNKVKEMEQ
jgi:hypothetical protein